MKQMTSFPYSPGKLHLLIGAVDTHMNLLIQMFGLEYVEELANSVGAILSAMDIKA